MYFSVYQSTYLSVGLCVNVVVSVGSCSGAGSCSVYALSYYSCNSFKNYRNYFGGIVNTSVVRDARTG